MFINSTRLSTRVQSAEKTSWGQRLLLILAACWLSTLHCSGQDAPAAKATEPPSKEHILPLIAKGKPLWHERHWDDDGNPVLTPLSSKEMPVDGQQQKRGALELPVKFPGKQEFVAKVTEPWTGWQEIQFELLLPEGLPDETILYITTQDDDYLWRQLRRVAPQERGRPVIVSVPIAGPKAAATWEPRGHERPWHCQTPRHLMEFGVSFEIEKKASYEGTVLLLGTKLALPGFPEVPNPVRRFHFSPRTPEIGQRCEFTFALDESFSDPYDRDSVSATASIILPDETNETIRGFYYEDFLYDRRIEDKTKVLQPYGEPLFKIRYAPRMTGKHTVTITVTTPEKTISLPAVSFIAGPAPVDYRGFLRRDPENCCFLQWDDGSHFWALGLNVRSPYDTRYIRVAPYSLWQNEGLPMYERLFKEYAKNGIEVVEVWMSSWWLALEWINDAPGFHGVGTYNQYRAWMLDHILQLAEKHGIYLILVMNNHGKFGALNDTEWTRNPYNVANGGFLKSCEEYFSNDRAKAAFKQLCDYIVARWGYADHILMWKLFTEVDLTGTTYDFYTQPVVAEWHKEMGAYLKQIDVNKRLVTTHWMLGYYRINEAIAVLPELDLLTTDAYYSSGGTRQLLAMLRGGTTFARGKGKPLLITEFGGSPHADSMGNLIKQAHLGIWTGFFHEAPAAPMFWWFALVDEKDLYPFYRALRNYAASEDRRGLTSSVNELTSPALVLNEMRSDTRLYVWGFDAAYYLSDEENLTPAEHADFVFKTNTLEPGKYTVEFWDCGAGKVTNTQSLITSADVPKIEIAIPPFKKDFAIKVKRSNALQN